MKYIELIIMKNGLDAVEAPNMKARFSYAVARNKQILENVLKAVDEVLKKTEKYEEYEKERKDILVKYAKRDQDGEPILENIRVGNMVQRSYRIPGIDDKNHPVNLELEALKKKYKTEIDHRDKQVKEYEEFIEKEAEDVELHMVAWKLVPVEGLSQQAMDGVIYMAHPPEDDENEKPKKKTEKKTPAKTEP